MATRPEEQATPEPDAPTEQHENPIKRFVAELETHLLEGAELATSTSSAETNVALAALGAIEGPPDPKGETEPSKADDASDKPGSEAR